MMEQAKSGVVQSLHGLMAKIEANGQITLIKQGASFKRGDSLVLISGDSQLKMLDGSLLLLTPNQPFSLDGLSPLLKTAVPSVADQVIDEALSTGIDLAKLAILFDELASVDKPVLSEGGTFFINEALYGSGQVTAGYDTRGAHHAATDGAKHLGISAQLYGDFYPHAVLTLNNNSLALDESLVVRKGDLNAADQEGHSEDPFGYGLSIIGYSQGSLVSAAASNINPAIDKFAYSLELGDEKSKLQTSNGSPIELSLENNVVVGKTGEGQVIFAVGINSSTGDITAVQYQSIFHVDDNSPDDSLDLAHLINAKLTITNILGNVSTASIDIGSQIHFEDDAPFIEGIKEQQISDYPNSNNVIIGKIDVDFGTDLAEDLVFTQDSFLELEKLGLTSNLRSLEYSLDDESHILTAKIEGTEDIVFTLTLSAITPDAEQTTSPTYRMEIFQSLDQPENKIILNIPVKAIDADGDGALGNIKISVSDGADAAGGENFCINAKEGDLDASSIETGGYPVQTNFVSLSISAGVDRLIPGKLTFADGFLDDLIKEFKQEVTSGGSHLDLTTSKNDEGVITLVAKDSGDNEIFQLILTPTNENQNLKIDVQLIQYKPLDQKLDGNKDNIISQDDNGLHINLSLQAQDSDGDFLKTPVSLQLTIKDGEAPILKDAEMALTETESMQEGQVPLDLGSDEIASLVFKDGNEMKTSLQGLTSGGHSTTYSIEGNVLILKIDDAHSPNINQDILKVTIKTDGSYETTLSGPLDQLNNDFSKLILTVQATDKDGDKSNLGNIILTIKDGSNAEGGNCVNLEVTEGSLPFPSTIAGYPVKNSQEITIQAGSDRLVPESVNIENQVLQTIIDELKCELKSNGQTINFNYDENTHTLIGKLNDGTPVLKLVLNSTQAENGYDIDIKITLTQYQPLDHVSTGNNTDYVRVNGTTIIINTPLQAKDSDGDYLTNPIRVSTTINDGAPPVIKNISEVLVSESDLDGGSSNHSGSTAVGDNEKACGQITVEKGSDEVVNYKIDVEAFNNHQNGQWTANGKDISLSYNSETKIYTGSAEGVNKFTITLTPDGKYTFTLLGAIDHPNVQGSNETNVVFSVIAYDADGDSSIPVNLPITIIDDIPLASNHSFGAVVEGKPTLPFDITLPASEGADNGKITSVWDGTTQHIITGNNYNLIQIHNDLGQELGTLYIKANGSTYFQSNIIDNNALNISQTIRYEMTDIDGDTSQANIIVNIKDKVPTLVVSADNGEEDIGRDENEALLTPPVGIPIHMTINIGDYDLGETVHQVLIEMPATEYGNFYYKGEVLESLTQGVKTYYQIPTDAFTSSDNITYNLSGLTYVPNADFSSHTADLNFLVQATIFRADLSNTFKLDPQKLQINVKGIADTPVFDLDKTNYNYSGTEDNYIALNVTGLVQDTDGSEEISHYLFKISESEGSLVGNGLTETSDGYWKISANDIASIKVKPNADFSGIIKVEAIAVSKELGNYKEGSQYAKSAPITLTVDVAPIADALKLTINTPYLMSKEDTAINIGQFINVSKAADNLDGSESTFVRIAGIPAGAVLSLYGEELNSSNFGTHVLTYTDNNGHSQTIQYIYDFDSDSGKTYFQISTDDIAALQLLPSPESNVDFNLTVQAVVIDQAILTSGIKTDDKITTPQNIAINMQGIADEPTFLSDAGSGWHATEQGIETIICEDGKATLNFGIVSGEKERAPNDNSETLTVVISGIPEGAQLLDNQGNNLTLTYVGLNNQGEPKYEVNLDTLSDLEIIPPLNSTADITLNAHIVVTENDGNFLEVDKQIVVHVKPVIDATDYSQMSSGLEDKLVTINWKPSFSDSQETITGLKIEGMPEQSILYIGSQAISSEGETSIILSEVQVKQLLDGSTLQFKGPEDSDKDVNLKATVTVSQKDVDDASIVYKNIVGNLHLDIQAVVEPNAKLQVLDSAGNKIVEPIQAVGGVIDLSQDSAQAHLAFQQLDFSSEEAIKTVVINGLGGEFVVIGGIYDGVGNWIVPEANLDHLQIISKGGYDVSKEIEIHAQIQDLGDNQEGDVSALVTRKTCLTLSFTGSGGPGDPNAEAGTININSAIVCGREDTVINLGTQLEAMLTLTNGTDSDVYALVINGPLDPGFSLSGSGVVYDFVNDRYVIPLNVNGEGLAVGEVLMQAPIDYAGGLKLDINWVATNMDSGDINTGGSVVSIPVDIAPIVDVPENAAILDNNHTPSLSLQVVKTEGLDANKQPTDHANSQTYYNNAYEDGLITLNLKITTADEDSEAIEQVRLQVNPQQGSLIGSDGSELTPDANGYVTIDYKDLGSIQFKPFNNYSGPVTVSVQVDLVDKVVTSKGEVVDEATYKQDLTFNILPVNDIVNFEGNTDLSGNEDMGGGIPLTGIKVNLTDNDGSEKIVSLVIKGVPDGFLVSSAQNLGGGEWKITVNDTSFDLSDIKIIPPENFSGSVDLQVVAYTKENLASLPQEAGNYSFKVNVLPVSDVVDIVNQGPTTEVSGLENGEILITLNVQARDNNASYSGATIPELTENVAETLLVTIKGVPEGAQISLPDSVGGTCELDKNTGNWILTIPSSSLSSIIYSPNDTNGVVSLTIEAQGVDGNAIPGPSTEIKIVLDITAVNDAPINEVPASFSVGEDERHQLSGLKIIDVDAGDGEMTVTLSVEHGYLNINNYNGVEVSGNNSNTVTLTGQIDALNDLLATGVFYQGNENFFGSDNLTMTTKDNSNSGTGSEGQDEDLIPIKVIARADPPELTIDSPFITAALGALIPLNIAAAVNNPTSDELSVKIVGIGDAALVNGSGQLVGTPLADGSWQVMNSQLGDLYLKGTEIGDYDIKVTAISDVGDGYPQESSPQVINLNVSDANLLQGSDLNEVLIGILGNQVLEGQGGNDTLFAGNGDHVVLIGGRGNDILNAGAGTDTFKWQAQDHGEMGQPDIDVINHFKPQMDKIDLSNLLQGNSQDYSHYMHLEYDTATNSTILSISTQGGYDGSEESPVDITQKTDQQIVLTGVDLVGAATNQADIINALFDNGQIIT